MAESSEHEDGALARLNARERQVFLLFLQGHAMKEIAAQMQIDPREASRLKSRLMDKVGVSTEVALVLFAVRTGLVIPETDAA